jgi:uncharacterized protein
MKPNLLSFLFALLTLVPAQTPVLSDPLTHARSVLSLLRQDRSADVANEFNAQMAAAVPPATLSQVWPRLQTQAGAFKSELDHQIANTRDGTAVTIGLQFERATLNIVVVFQPDNKISGLQFVPRAAAAAVTLPLPSGLTEESVTVGGGEFPLSGTLTLPAGTGRVPGIVLVHGSGPEDRDESIGPNKPFRDLAWGLAARGIAVLRYEKRTRQYGEKLASDLNLTVREETIDDAVSAVQVLRRHARISSHVFVLGHSLGGMLAPRIAQANQDISGLIILAGNTRALPDLMVEQLEYIASLSPDSASKQATMDSLKQQAAKASDPAIPLNTPVAEIMGAPAAYWKDLNAYKPAAVAASLTIPMLILQGERDYQVAMKDFEGWRDGLKGRKNVTMKSYPDLNHLFMTGTGKSTPTEYQVPGNVALVVIDDIAAWVKKN